jgi:predicted PurR-regulated permease PerM
MTTTSVSVIKKLLVLFLVFAGLHFAKNFLMPLSIGAVLATLFLPLCKRMECNKIPRGLAALLCLLLLVFSIAAVGSLIGWQIFELTDDFDLIKLRSIQVFDHIQEYIFSHLDISVEEQSQILRGQQKNITDIIQGIAGSLTSIFTYFILILVYVLFILYYRSHLKQFIIKLAPASQKEEIEKVVYSVAEVSQQYLLGLFKMIVCLWIMYGIGFSLLGINNALFFAFLCGLLEIAPFIGNITGTTITVLVAAVQGSSLSILLGVIGTYGVIQFIQGWVLEPLIVGSQVKINALSTIIALVIGELVWGIPGIFLAIPLIAMFKIICDHIQSLKPYGFLIGETVSRKGEPGFIKQLKNFSKKKIHK